MANGRQKIDPKLVANPDNPFSLPAAFVPGGKFDILTPLDEADENTAQLNARIAASVRSQLGSLQGNVATLQQVPREAIHDGMQPAFNNLGNLINPAVNAITSGLGEVHEYAAGLGVPAPGTFPALPSTGVAYPGYQRGGSGKVERVVKKGEIGSKEQLRDLIRSGKVVERNSPLGKRRYVWTSGGDSGGESSGERKEATPKSSASSQASRTGSGIVSKVQGLAKQISQAGQSALGTQQSWFNQGNEIVPNVGMFAPLGVVPNAPAAGVQGALDPGGILAGGNLGGAGIAGVGPGMPGGAANPALVGDFCTVIMDPNTGEARVVPSVTVHLLTPPGWVVIGGPSREACAFQPTPVDSPDDLDPDDLPAGGEPLPGLARPGGPAPTVPSQAGPYATTRPPDCPPCPPTPDGCTYDIRTAKAGKGRTSQGDSSGGSEGPDDDTQAGSPVSQWRSYSAINGSGVYVTQPGENPKSDYDCKIAEGTNRDCVEKIAEAVSGSTLQNGKSDSAEQYQESIGNSVTNELCADYKYNTLNPQGNTDKGFSYILGLTDKDNEITFGVTGLAALTPVGKSWNTILTVFTRFLDTALNLPLRLAANDTCTDARLYPIYVMKALYGFAQRWLGFTPSAPLARLEQAENLLCTPILPSADNAIEGKLTGQITDDEYKCWTEASGYPKEIWDKMLAARKSRLAVDQLTTLWRRGDISDQEWESRIRELGWISYNDTRELEILTRQYPGMQDIVRFMVRDVDDGNIVNTFGLNHDFENKFGGRLRGWAKQQGIPDEVALAFWQAHWEIPSPTQLYEMYHRLRHKPEYGGPVAFEQIVRTALEQQDILPFWIDKFLAVSFRPLTRVDVRRAYNLGILSDEQVLQAYRDAGYSDENAETLQKFAAKERRKSWKGLWYVKAAIAGQLSIGDVRLEAGKEGQPAEFNGWAEQYIPRAIELARRKVCLGFIRKRYLRGEIDERELAGELAKAGIAMTYSGEIASGWACEKASKSKTLAAAQLCKLYGEKIIDIQEFQKGLHNLGYSADDAMSMLASCVKGLELKERKTLEANAKAKAAQDEKLRKLAEKNAADADKEAEKQAKRLDNLHKAAEKRRKALITAADELAKKTGESITLTLPLVTDINKRLRVERGFNQNDSVAQVQLLVEAVTEPGMPDLWGMLAANPLPPASQS